MPVTQSVCCDVFDGDVWLDKYCAKIFAIGIFLRILAGIDNTSANTRRLQFLRRTATVMSLLQAA
jgi:hypothetical protein